MNFEHMHRNLLVRIFRGLFPALRISIESGNGSVYSSDCTSSDIARKHETRDAEISESIASGRSAISGAPEPGADHHNSAGRGWRGMADDAGVFELDGNYGGSERGLLPGDERQRNRKLDSAFPGECHALEHLFERGRHTL